MAQNTKPPLTAEPSLTANDAPLTPEDSALGARLRDPAIREQMTPFGKRLEGVDIRTIAANARPVTPGVDSMRELVDPRIDRFSPTATCADWDSEDAAREFNDVGPGRVVVWKRRPEIYRDELNEVERTLYSVSDAAVVTRRSDGKPLHSDDLVAISIPAEMEERRQMREVLDYVGWAEGIEDESQHGSISRNAPDFDQRKREASSAAQARSAAMGIGSKAGSATGGMEYLDALNMISDDDRLSMEARERQGGRHVPRDERQAEAADRSREAAKGSKTFGGLAGPPNMDRWERQGDKDRTAAAARRQGQQSARGGRQ